MEWFDKGNSNWEASSKASSTEELLVEEEFPEGRTYPLNSKRLAVAGAGKETGSEVTKWSINRRDTEVDRREAPLEREPRNVQVVVGDNERIFLVGGKGVIVSTEHVSNKCTSHLHVRDIVEDPMGNNFNNNLILSQNVTGNKVSNKVESLCSAQHESHLENKHLSQS